MAVIYIAGKYRAETEYEVGENSRLARTVGLELPRAGHIPVIPHTMYGGLGGGVDDKVILDAGIALLDRCDAVLVLPNWSTSQGTKLEIDRAFDKKIPVSYYPHMP